MTDELSFEIESLGKCTIDSPLQAASRGGQRSCHYVDEQDRILLSPTLAEFERCQKAGIRPPSFERSGPRRQIYFDPSKLRVAIVTCGGLCPGLNDVIRAIVMELWYHYRARNISGIRYGYQGLMPSASHEPMPLTPDVVEDINNKGGTILGSSRGNAPIPDLVDALERMNINVFVTIGGDGTQRGALAIHEEAKRRGYRLSVVGIPKTIDNDIAFVEQSFGFETAFSIAAESVACAHVEAAGAYNGIGIVKLMGRQSGFIAAKAALAMNVVNYVLIPEVKFDLDGDNGFLAHLRRRLNDRHHAVICVAEGVGQDWLVNDPAHGKCDASGNAKLADIGPYLSCVIADDLKAKNIPHSIKYIDPSYTIRSSPTVPDDSVFCAQLGQNAVHAAMAGKTGLLVGRWNGVSTHIPLAALHNRRNTVSPDSELWWNVLEATGQPMDMTNG
jgi:6-phosphofructokinase 1